MIATTTKLHSPARHRTALATMWGGLALGTIWATRAGRRWTAWAATLVFVTAVCLALAGLTVRDTSVDVGLVPRLDWLQVLPCVLGLVAVTLLWRSRR